MKRFFSLLCVSFLALTASAQITWSVKGGIGSAKCVGEDLSMDSRMVGRIGIGIEKPLTPEWSIMPSLEFAMKGASFSEDEYGDYSEDVSIYYLQIPVLAAYRLNLNDSWNMTLKAGPYFAYGVGGKIDSTVDGESYSENVFDDCERFDFGLDLAADFEYHRYVIGLEYEFGLTSIMKDETVKNSAFYVTVGYKF